MTLSQFSTSLSHVLCLVLMVLHTAAWTNGMPMVERKIYCSQNLSDAIRLICGGRYNSLARNFPDSVGSNSHRSSVLKRYAPDEGVFYRPLQSGPVHECCRRPCGYAELKLYCAPD